MAVEEVPADGMGVEAPADGVAEDGPANGVAVEIGGVSVTRERRLRRGAFSMAGKSHTGTGTMERETGRENKSRFIGGPQGRGSKTYPRKETKAKRN